MKKKKRRKEKIQNYRNICVLEDLIQIEGLDEGQLLIGLHFFQNNGIHAL